jgi:hypothetical protein
MTATGREEIMLLPKLTDADTFSLWDLEIKILMRAKELMSIVDGSDLVSDQGIDEENVKKWKTRNANTT